MKKIIILILIIVTFSAVYSKEIPVIKAEIGYRVDFSEESQKNFKRVLDIMERGKKPKDNKEQKEIEKIAYENRELYDSTKSSIWDVFGDGDCYYLGVTPKKIITSSQLKREKNIDYKGENLSDDSFKTAWVEGR